MTDPSYDVADLYKVEIAVPAAFKVVAEGSVDIGADVRRAMRDAMHDAHLMERCTRDIHRLLDSDGETDEDYLVDIVELWDWRGSKASGQNYSEELPW